MRAEEYHEVRKAVKVVKPPPPYEIPESRTAEESKVEEPEADLKTNQDTTTLIDTLISTV